MYTFEYFDFGFILAGISMIVFIGFTSWVINAFGELPLSYSNTYYKIKESYKNWGFLFPAYCVITSFFLMALLVYLSGKNSWLQISMLFIGLGLPLVGASADHKSSKYESYVHIAGVVMSLGGLLVWAGIYFIGYIGRLGWKYPYWILIATLIGFAVWGLINWKKRTFIWEMGGFVITYEIMTTILFFEYHLL